MVNCTQTKPIKITMYYNDYYYDNKFVGLNINTIVWADVEFPYNIESAYNEFIYFLIKNIEDYCRDNTIWGESKYDISGYYGNLVMKYNIHGKTLIFEYGN